MAETQPPFPVKYFIAALFHDLRRLDEARGRFVDLWGAMDCEGSDREFDVTGYYRDEMGEPLYRRIMSFEKLEDPTLLVSMKLACNDIEDALRVSGKRTVNCDAGYLDHNKVVLASAKEAGQKIYIDKGIYADLAGRYKDGAYRPFEWSFPDFKDNRYGQELLAIRALYLSQLKALRRVQNGKIKMVETP
jgi:hypothetical protein